MTTYRARARNLLTEITRQVRQALDDAGISLDVFVMIPSSGDAIATFGTAADPADEAWDRASKIISSIVGESRGWPARGAAKSLVHRPARRSLLCRKGRRDEIPRPCKRSF